MERADDSNSLEIQVPTLSARDSANRFPDLVVLCPEHIPLMKKRLTITMEMPLPEIVVEVMSAGKENRDHDLVAKRDQYAAREIPEYGLIDPEVEAVSVLQFKGDVYVEVGTFRGSARVKSFVLPALDMRAAEIFSNEQLMTSS